MVSMRDRKSPEEQEEELLGEFNAWLDCERFSDEWTEEEQGILDEALMLIAKKQRRLEGLE